jgi:hypothetical protein
MNLVGIFPANSLSISCLKSSSGCPPSIAKPLTKNIVRGTNAHINGEIGIALDRLLILMFGHAGFEGCHIQAGFLRVLNISDYLKPRC